MSIEPAAQRRPVPSVPLNAGWDGRPEEYERLRECWLSERRLDFLTQRIREAELPSGAAILEIGSGTGWLLYRLAERLTDHDFIGVEPDSSYVDFANARARRNERHVVGTAETLAAGDYPHFRMVLSNDMLHHVQSEADTYAGVAAVSAAGCVWWSIEPNFLNPYTFLKQQFSYGERNFLPRQSMPLAAAVGWRLRERRHLFLVPPFVRTPPTWMVELERRFEHNPLLSGGLCHKLVYGISSTRDRSG